MYYQLNPPSEQARGLLVLLPGRGESAPNVLRATNLGREAARRGFVVLVLALNDRICLDAGSTRFLDEAIGQALRQYPALAAHIVLGGFSAGGQLAFAYAETLVRDTIHRPWRVRAVLGVDPPLDLAEHWQRAEFHLAQADCSAFRAGDQRTITELTQALGGSPAHFPASYHARSAFIRTDSLGGNAQWLRGVPVRVYCEPDLAFWQNQYCPTLQPEDLNAYSAVALISCLQRQGNAKARYIQTTGKGFQGKHRMPHSWSIVEAVECAQWLQDCLE